MGELGCYGDPDNTVGALATPEAARLELRFNHPVGHGALLEVSLMSAQIHFQILGNARLAVPSRVCLTVAQILDPREA